MSKLRQIVVGLGLAVAALLFMAMPVVQAAEPGDRNIGFGHGDGRAAHDLADTLGEYADVHLLDARVMSDGRIIILGRLRMQGSPGSPVYRGFLLRHRADGEVDTNFGTNGITLLPGARGCRPYNLLVDDSGRILVAAGWSSMNHPASGGHRNRAVLYRFTSNGRLDPSWGRADGYRPRNPIYFMPVTNCLWSVLPVCRGTGMR